MTKYKHICALLLVAVMLFGLMPTAIATELQETAVTNVRTAFLSGDILVDGTLDEHGWLMNQRIGAAGTFGVQWKQDALMLAVETGSAAELTVTLNGKSMILALADLTSTGEFQPLKVAKRDSTVEMKLAMADFGITDATTGKKLNLELKLDDAAFQGTLELLDIDWFAAENGTHPIAAVCEAAKSDAFRNYQKVVGGYQLFNRFDTNGAAENGNVSVVLRAQSNERYLPLYDHTSATYAEMDVRVDDMPVLTAEQATAGCKDYYPCSGLGITFFDKYNSSHDAHAALLGIYNTADGLVLTGRFSKQNSQAVALNKKLGETFRLGLLWDTDGDVEVWLDGEAFHTFSGIEQTLHWVGEGSVCIQLIDFTNGVESADYSMDATVTNIALGKRVNPDETGQGGTRQKNYLTAFTAETITVDGNLAEGGWNMSSEVVDENSKSLKAAVGMQWDADMLYLAVNYLGCTSVDLMIAGKSITVTSEGTVTGDFEPDNVQTGTDANKKPVVELAIPFEALGVYVRTVGTDIPFTARVDSAVRKGVMTLSDVDWSFAANACRKIAQSDYNKSDNCGFAVNATGCYLYDRFNASGGNLDKTRTYVSFFNNKNDYSPLNDHTAASFTQFDVRIDKMPMWTKEQALALTDTEKRTTRLAVNGFTASVSDARNDRGYSNILRFGIYNSTDGLIFTCLKADGTHEVKELNRNVGDTITVGIEWHEDLGATVYIDGEKFAAYTGASTNLGWASQQGLSFELKRSAATVSADDDMEVTVSNVAVGQKLDLSSYIPTPASPDDILTAFTADAVTIDGSLADAGWLLNINVLDSGGILKGKAGAQWDNKNLYLAADLRGAGAAVLTVNGKELTVTDTGSLTTALTDVRAAAVDGIIELAIPLEQLGVVVYDYGTKVPVSVSFGGGAYTGSLYLSEVDWFIAENKTHPNVVKSSASVPMGAQAANQNQGVAAIEDGWQMYDLYDAAGDNVSNIRTYLQFSNDSFTEAVNDKSTVKYMEFDLNVRSMPVYTAAEATGWSQNHSNYGFTWVLADQYMDNYWSNCLSFGIFNSPDGLVLSALRNGVAQAYVPLNRQVGDCIRIGTSWELDGSVRVYVDGELLTTIEKGVVRLRWFASDTYMFNMLRSTEAPNGPEDSMVVEITNIAIGTCSCHSILDGLTFDTIRGENTAPNAVSYDLVLPDELEGRTLTWTSSHPDIISSSGIVTAPETVGEKVTLTASLDDGTNKVFQLIVTGTGVKTGNVLVVEKDYNPASGQGKPLVAFQFVLDTTNNSIVYDMQERQRVNVAVLKDSDSAARLNEEVLSLWISDDNQTYTRVKDFKLLHRGDSWYLYDFDAAARYVKIHCTHFEGDDADFINAPESMIRAYYEDSFGANGGEFGETTVTVTNNQTVEQRDVAWMLENVTAQRVLLNGRLLYHYVENGNTIVRIPYLAAGESVTLTILSGNDSAMDISNKEYVYEVTYGTREAWETERRLWVQTLKDGTVVGISGIGAGQKGVCFSYDHGRTWTEYELIEAAVDWITADCGGFIYDTHTGRLIFYGMKNGATSNDLSVNFIYSDDGGHTWQRAGELISDKTYNITYTQGLVLSCYDGEQGPNVDFVVPIAAAAGDDKSLCTTGAYSTDGGLTWKTSENWIFYNADHSGFEGGLSEATIMEREDGVMVLYARNQFNTEIHFAKSYSYDHGVTWGEQAALSNVYTTNTQPIFYNYNGAELLTWGGNNCLGGDSYIRTPFSVGVTYDGGENFRNIQDLYVKYSLQGLTINTMNRITNQVVTRADEDTLLLTWWNRTDRNTRNSNIIMRVEDFTEHFYYTKGVYDSFEHGTVKYEGWDTIVGTASVSTEQHSDGVASMKVDSGIISRSVPYVQDGRIELDIYVSGSANLKLDFQSAFTDKHAFCAPIGISVVDNAITFIGAEAPSGQSLQDGWNTLVFDFDLSGGFATCSLNGGDAVDMPVNREVGDYICFMTLNSNSTIYVDNVLLQDNDYQIIPERSVDRSALNAAIAAAEALNAADYTAESWGVVERALAAAKALAENADEAAVAAAAEALNNAIRALVKKANTPNLPDYPFLPSIIGNVVEASTAFPFTDVPATAWFYDEVKAAWEKKLIDGVSRTLYKPDAPLTVAQAIKLSAALHQMYFNGEVTLKNGTPNWYDPYVDYAVRNGIIETRYGGYTLAQMNAAVSREEFVHIFFGAMHASCYVPCNTVADNAIPDVKMSDNFADEIYMFYRAGILVGSDGRGTFHPASSIKRSEVAAILVRMFDVDARRSIDLG